MYKNLAAALTAACLFSSPVFSQAQEPLKIGFVYVAPLAETGWVHQHDEGRKAVEAALGARVKTTYVENVAEGPDAERVIRDLAQQGHKLIFTPSFGYMEP
ncbi:MAG: BMP family ABC transporter substrate-binding protein, partial [Ramlibacter sp.]